MLSWHVSLRRETTEEDIGALDVLQREYPEFYLGARESRFGEDRSELVAQNHEREWLDASDLAQGLSRYQDQGHGPCEVGCETKDEAEFEDVEYFDQEGPELTLRLTAPSGSDPSQRKPVLSLKRRWPWSHAVYNSLVSAVTMRQASPPRSISTWRPLSTPGARTGC